MMEPSKANWASSTNGWPIFADLWNSGTCINFFIENVILLTDLVLQKISHLQKLSNYTKVNKHFQLLKMDLNHKNIYLSWALVQIYTFDHVFAPFCAHIWRHISYSALYKFLVCMSLFRNKRFMIDEMP